MAGIIHNDRKLGAEVRRMGLRKLKDILGDDSHEKYAKDFQQAVILKLSGSILPRINEHSGLSDDEGEPEPILVRFIDETSKNNRDTD